ncbi:MAG: tetratricopeptide repeat protein [Anaerovoracaceae bacterium]
MNKFTYLIVLMLAICLCACNGSSNLDELLELGVKYLDEQNYEEAIITFEQAIEIDEKCEQAYMGLADAYFGNGDIGSARSILEKGSKLTDSNEIKNRLEALDAEIKNKYDNPLLSSKDIKDVYVENSMCNIVLDLKASDRFSNTNTLISTFSEEKIDIYSALSLISIWKKENVYRENHSNEIILAFPCGGLEGKQISVILLTINSDYDLVGISNIDMVVPLS